MSIRGREDKAAKSNKELRELAFIDDLTDFYNRRYLYQYLPSELKEMQRQQEQLCLLVIDVDSFKQVNDTYGHLCGDKILLNISEVLRKHLRENDTIIRYAGDEFIAVLPGTDEAVAADIAGRIVEKIQTSPFKSEDNTEINLTLSVGLAMFPRDAQSPEQLIHQADRALYSCKRGGRNRICTVSDITAEVLDEAKLQQTFADFQLIGRKEELSKLKGLLGETEKKRAQLALIKGDWGIGKTRLLHEFKKQVRNEQIIEVSVSCSAEISQQSYRILLMALENLFISLGEGVRQLVRSLPEAQIIQLANYIPVLKQHLPEKPKGVSPAGPAQAQIDLFKGICQSLIYIVKNNSLLLMIDDFHWIDQGTLQLFNYLIKDIAKLPIFIAGAYQDKELEKRRDAPALQELLNQLKQEKLVNEITLEPFTQEEVLEMLTANFSGIQVAPRFVELIYNVSSGNPLFIEEILRSLVNKQFIFYKYGKWQAREIVEATFPPFLKEAIQKRVDTLDEETKSVVCAAAVIGDCFDFNILCQLLEKNPGYVLDMLDRAAERSIITPQTPFQTDKFNFNSGIIRDIIYSGLDPRQRQILHRKLGLIEEKMHKDNIFSVAASLGYHFGKAQDAEKESLYSGMLLEKAAQMPTYEDIFGFLQEALLDRAAEVAAPLSDDSMKLIPATIRTLRLAIQNVRLYPAHSSIRKSFIEQAYKNISEILSQDNPLIVGTAENRLLINSEEISQKASREAVAGAFVALMIDHRIKSINFKKDLTEEQFVAFLEAISQEYDELIPEGGLSALLRKNGVTQIRVDEVRYEQTTRLAKQRTQMEDAMLTDYLIGKASKLEGNGVTLAAQLVNDPASLAGTLKRLAEQTEVKEGQDRLQLQADVVAASLQKLGELNQDKMPPQLLRQNIAKAIMSLDFKLRSRVLQSPLSSPKAFNSKTKAADVITEAVGELSDAEIMEMLTREFVVSGGNLVNLHNLVRRFLLIPERQQQLFPQFKSKLQLLGLNKEEVPWVLGEELWQGTTLQEKAERIMMLPSENYLRLGVSKEIDKIISGLLEEGNYNQAGEVIDKLLTLLEGESKELRSVIIADLGKINTMLIVKEQYFLLEQIIKVLVGRLDKEKEQEIYYSCVYTLANICTKLIKRHNFIQAEGVLRELNLRMEKESKLPALQQEIIAQVKDEAIASSSMLTWITQLLKQKLEGRHDFWELSKVIAEIGPKAIGPVFSLAIDKNSYADPFKIYAFRWNVAKVLKSLGEEAILYLKDRLADERIELIKVVLELLGHLQNANALPYLQPLLKHKDSTIRKEVITTLGKIGGKGAVKLLSELLQDEDKEVRSASIWALANIGTKDVLPLLKPLLQEEAVSAKLGRAIQKIEKGI